MTDRLRITIDVLRDGPHDECVASIDCDSGHKDETNGDFATVLDWLEQELRDAISDQFCVSYLLYPDPPDTAD